MTSSIGIVLCRLAAVLILVQALQNMGLFLPTAFSSGLPLTDLLATILVIAFLPGAAGIAVWIFAERIARTGEPISAEPVGSPPREAEIVRAGTVLIGLYAILFGIVAAVRAETMFVAADAIQSGAHAIGAPDNEFMIRLPERIAYAAEIALGIVLILGRRRIVTLLDDARRAGT